MHGALLASAMVFMGRGQSGTRIRPALSMRCPFPSDERGGLSWAASTRGPTVPNAPIACRHWKGVGHSRGGFLGLAFLCFCLSIADPSRGVAIPCAKVNFPGTAPQRPLPVPAGPRLCQPVCCASPPRGIGLLASLHGEVSHGHVLPVRRGPPPLSCVSFEHVKSPPSLMSYATCTGPRVKQLRPSA